MSEANICFNCNGSGWNTCCTCKGKGNYKKLFTQEFSETTDKLVKCKFCNGTGRKKCGFCYGIGYITDETRKKNNDFLKKLNKNYIKNVSCI